MKKRKWTGEDVVIAFVCGILFGLLAFVPFMMSSQMELYDSVCKDLHNGKWIGLNYTCFMNETVALINHVECQNGTSYPVLYWVS